MRAVFILNDAPYGSERRYNALRLANALLKNDPENTVTVFLMADAVSAAKKGQQTPEGYYNADLIVTHRPMSLSVAHPRTRSFDGDQA